jgi:hypothetical protein
MCCPLWNYVFSIRMSHCPTLIRRQIYTYGFRVHEIILCKVPVSFKAIPIYKFTDYTVDAS